MPITKKKLSPANPALIGADLYERLDLSQARVDRANSVIHNVKILGGSSPNRHGMDVQGTDYLPSAHEQVRELYEGMQVNVGHPPRNDPDAERQPPDRNGVLYDIHTERGNETFGDWQLIPSHAMTPTFLDCAENPRLHSQFALSHNAKGYGQIRGDRYQISEIPKVRAVDVVCRGGVNSTLFESRDTTMKPTLKDVLESATPGVQKRFVRLFEMDDTLGDMPIETPPAPDAAGDHMAHLGELLKSLVLAVKDGSMTVEESCGKIMAAIKVMDDGGDPDDDEDADPTDTVTPAPKQADDAGGKGGFPPKAKGDTMEAKEVAELTALRSEKQVRDICESLDFRPEPIDMKALQALTSDADRRAQVRRLKDLTKPAKAPAAPTTPRTATGRSVDVTESRSANAGKDGVRDQDYDDTSKAAREKRAAYMKS